MSEKKSMAELFLYRVAVSLLRGKQTLAEEDLLSTACCLAGCLCDPAWFDQVPDKVAWVFDRMQKLAPSADRSLLTAAARRGVRSTRSAGSRRKLLVDLESVRSDLQYVLDSFAQNRSGGRAWSWTSARVQIALALILEARRAYQESQLEFFCSGRQIADLAGIAYGGVSRSIKDLQGVVIDVASVGDRYAATRYRIDSSLKAHLDSNPAANGSLDVDELGLAGLLRSLGSSSPEFCGVGYKAKLLLDSGVVLQRSDGSHRKLIRLSLQPPAQPTRSGVQMRPVSWTDPRSDSPAVPNELKAARPCRERLADNGLPIDQVVLSKLLAEHRAELEKRGLAPVLEEEAEEAERGLVTAEAVELSDEQLQHRVGLLEAIADRVHEDGRVRSFWYDGSATTNRLVSVGARDHRRVCLQNLPKALLSKLIQPPEGFSVVHADIRSMDACSLAEMSRDPQLLEDLESDVYQAFAGEVGVDRDSAKLAFLLWCYGAEPKRLAQSLGISEERAVELFLFLATRYPRAAETLDRFVEHHRKKFRTHPSICGYIRAGGRPETVGRNIPVQSTSADICRRFEIEVLRLAEERGLGLEPILSVYDGFWWLVSEGDEQVAQEVLTEALAETRGRLGLQVRPQLGS